MISSTSFPSLADVLRHQAAQHGSKLALGFLGPDLSCADTLTFEQLSSRSHAIASQLLETRQKGDRVLLAFDNGLDAALLFWACMVAGLVAVPAPAPDQRRSKAGWRRLELMCQDAQMSMAFTRSENVTSAREHMPQVPWATLDELGDWRSEGTAHGHGEDMALGGPGQSLAYLQYTSGSTGQPRGVVISHANALAQCRALCAAEPIDASTARSLIWLPWFHDYGLIHALLMPVYTGVTSYLMSTQQFLLRPLRWLEAVARHSITHCGAPDFAYEACVQALAKQPDWNQRLDHWKLATCGAEPIRERTLARFAEAFEPFGFRPEAFAPSYGLAEAVLAVSMGNSRERPVVIQVNGLQLEQTGKVLELPGSATEDKRLVGSGRVLPGLEVQIVDSQTGTVCAPDEVGEIWVRGPSISRAYWGQPAASLQRFRGVLSTAVDCDQLFLKTGDLGFFKDQELFVAGRLSDLMVVHGRNIHPQDLEETAQAVSPWIRNQGVVAVAVEHAGREQVVLLVECRRQMPEADLAPLEQSLRRAVANAHELDLHEVVLLRGSVLPRTSSGKLQRQSARQLRLNGGLSGWQMHQDERETPQAVDHTDEHERAAAELAPLWAEVLNVEQVPLDGHFLVLGGDSLLGTQLISRVRERFGVALTISSLFGEPTLRAMARHLVAQRAALPSTAPLAPPTPAELAEPALADHGNALSYSQERMGFMHSLVPDSSAYNVPLALRLHGTLNADAVERSLQSLVDRHEILRTRFVLTDKGLVGEVIEQTRFQIVRLDLDGPGSSVPGDEPELQALVNRLSQEPFDITQWPLMRAWLIRMAPEEHVLLLVLHHIVSDQWSMVVMGKELAQAYQQVLSGISPLLPGPARRFADHARWHRRWFEAEREQQEVHYWTQRLAHLKPVALTTDFPRPRQPSFCGASLRLPLPLKAVDALAAFAAHQNATLAMAWLALMKVFLYRHSGQTDLAVGMPIANRHHAQSEDLVGSLVNTLVVRTSLDSDPSFVTVLARVRAAALEAFEHQDMPFEWLVRQLDPARDFGQQPLFNVMFNVVNTPVRGLDFESLHWSRMDVDRGASQVDLTVIVDPLLDRSLVLEYSTDLFHPDTVARMGQHLLTLLVQVSEMAERPVSTWPMLDQAEQHQLLSWGQGNSQPMTGSSLAALLEQGMLIDPGSVALVCGGRQVLYRELEQSSRALLEHLQSLGVIAGHRIGICLPRGVDMVVALLAVLRLGAGYVPLDPTYPEERIAHQIADADLVLLIGTQATLAPHAGSAVSRLCLDQEWTGVRLAPSTIDETPSMAYLIYTSGSTGRPKGVEVPQHALLNFMNSMVCKPGLSREDRVLAVTTFSFDIAVLELLVPISVGATVVLAIECEASDGRTLKQLIETHRVTLMQATPSRWHLLLAADWMGRPGMRALVGGESLSPDLASALLERCDEVWNMYGPTETTVWSTCWRVQADAPISLGRAIDNTYVLVLDSADQMSPVGAWGEIWIGGEGLSAGYWCQPELTAQRFRTFDHLPVPARQRYYRTGDRGRWRHDGSLEHGGRLDDQVKLRGFRIELGEVQTCLEQQAGVLRCVAMVREDSPGDQRLVAYLTIDEHAFDLEATRTNIRRWLPAHMVPAHLMLVSEWPVLPNGKIHRAALPLPAVETSAHNRVCQAPRSETEWRLWHIWQNLLQLQEFGVEDSFFDLGGHSMLALSMTRQIEREFETPLPLNVLFQSATVASIAQYLTEKTTSRDKLLVSLRRSDQPHGLFLLAGAYLYRQLAHHLDIDIPVYGLYSQTEIDLLEWPVDSPLPQLSIDALADEYLQIIRAQQPHGPYFIGGYSFGGVMAYEVAQRLIGMGETVGLLVMLDCAKPGKGWKRLKKGIMRRIRMFRRDGWQHLTHIGRQISAQKESLALPGGRRTQAYAQAVKQYQAVPSGSIPVAFFQAAGDASTEPAYGWGSLVENLVLERVPGKHGDILEMPNAIELARRIQPYLADALAAPILTPAAPIQRSI
jgi:amino acid adenylation domain-containing protein